MSLSEKAASHQISLARPERAPVAIALPLAVVCVALVLVLVLVSGILWPVTVDTSTVETFLVGP